MVSMAYNADQQRAAKQSTDGAVTGFLYDYKRLLCETDNVGGAISQTYASDTTEEFGDLIGEDGQYIHQYDAQANTNALLDDTGTVQAQYKYFAFGQVSAVSIDGGSWTAEDWSRRAGMPLDFTSNMLAGGKKQYYLDQEIALYLLGSGNNGRYYDATTGRFLSEDPTGEAGGDTNLFRYASNDPVNNSDPSGHDKQPPPPPAPPQHVYKPSQQPPAQNPNTHMYVNSHTRTPAPSHGTTKTNIDTVDQNQQTIGATQHNASQSVLTKTAINTGVSPSNAISSTISTKGLSDLNSSKAQTLQEISPKPALPALPISKGGQVYNPKPEEFVSLGHDSQRAKSIAEHNKLVEEALKDPSHHYDFSHDPYGCSGPANCIGVDFDDNGPSSGGQARR